MSKIVSDDERDENLVATLDSGNEPINYKEAIESPDASEWKVAMQDEYDSLMKNKTWVVDTLPLGSKPVKCKWVFKKKRNPDGSVARFKARLVAKGYSQIKGIDYEETFSPVVRLDTVRFILSLIAKHDLEVVQFDVKTAFLNGSLQEEIWMCQPEGFEKGEGKACLLKRSLYGLKQASRVWHECFISFLKTFHLQPLVSDSCVLVRVGQPDELIVAVYVDDGLACSKNEKLLESAVKYLKTRFEITTTEASFRWARDQER